MSTEDFNNEQSCTTHCVMQNLNKVGLNYNVYEYRPNPPTKEEIANAKKHKRKDSLKLILDLIICLIFAPAISGFIGWLIPLPFSILTSIFIGLIALEYFTGRRT